MSNFAETFIKKLAKNKSYLGQDGNWGASIRLEERMLEEPEYIAHMLENLMKSVGMGIIALGLVSDDSMVIKPRLIEKQDHFSFHHVREIMLIVEVWKTRKKHVSIMVPEILYDTQTMKPKEWKCGYCGRPHPMEHRECLGGCQAPRPLLIQEYK